MRSRLASLFYENAKATPDKQAIWCDGKTVTYKEMADLVSRYSNLLLSQGAAYGDHIAIPMNNSIESVALFSLLQTLAFVYAFEFIVAF